MAYILVVVGRVLSIIAIVILSVLTWKTSEYFSRLPENDRNKPLIAWNVIVIFLEAIYLVIKLILA